MADQPTGPGSETALRQRLILAAPHPADTLEEYGRELYRFYSSLTSRLSAIVSELATESGVSAADRQHIDTVLDGLAVAAVTSYNAQYFSLVADFPSFQAWTHLRNHDLVITSLDRLPDAVAKQVRATLAELPGLDLAPAELGAHIAGLPAAQRQSKVREVLTELDRTYDTAVFKPIVEDRMGLGPRSPTLSFPSRRDAFIPQAFKVLRTPSASAHVGIEDESTWADVSVREDLWAFLLAYLESTHSLHAPLIIVGAPGSGKSLLTEMIAAQMAPQQFTRLRVELRSAATQPEISIHRLLGLQIELDTNGQVINWTDFSKEIIDRPPVAIFDGFDELLMTGGARHASYLEEVQRFQDIEAAQERPLRAIVTSRTTLMNQATVPPNSTVVRLLPFDDRRCREWITRWNEHNAANFDAETPAFALPARADVRELAAQPLLLVLLALFDADGNQLCEERLQVRRARLYDNLLTSFIRRQCHKEARERGVAAHELAQVIAGNMRRLGVAAMSMFNRQTLHVARKQLRRDLEFFESKEVADENADALFGQLLFVHASRSSASLSHGDRTQPATYEFLHDTFGEFLVADFILRLLVEEICGQVAHEPNAAYAARVLNTSQPDKWCARMMFTALHTRPVVLEMMRSWLPDLLEDHDLGQSAFAAQFDTFIDAQLKRVFDSPLTSTSLAANPAPYAPLPLIGHYAIYTLNLMIVRVLVIDDGVVFEAGDAMSGGRASRWEQLNHLWQSWFTAEEITAVATLMDSSHHGDHVRVRARDSSTKAAGIEGFDLGGQMLDIELEVLLRAVRSDGWPRDSKRVDALARHARQAVGLVATSRSHRDLLVALTAVDAPGDLRSEARLVMRDPQHLADLWALPDSFASAYIGFCASAAPKWGADMVALTLGGDRPEEVARQAPAAFAACVDAAYPSRPPAYVVSGRENAAWLAPVIRRLLKQDDIELVVLLALLDLAARLGTPIDDAKLVDECRSRLRSGARGGLADVSADRLRRLIERASEAPGDGLCEWVVSATALFEPTLPGDILIDLDRLRLIVDQRTRIDRSAVKRWPILHATGDMDALSRLVACLDPTETDEAEGTLGRQGVLRELTNPGGSGPVLLMPP